MSQAKGSIVQQAIWKTQAKTLGFGLAFSAFGTFGALAQQGSGPDQVFNIPDRPTLNFYGSAGLIDMPSGEALPDGQFVIGVSNFGGSTRTTVTFQATPRLSASFRYTGIKEANIAGFETYRDRSFDIRYLINKESRVLPAVTIGLQDFAGTGIYAGEYIAATKTFAGAGRIPGTVKVTAGLGWGRLGSSGSIGTPFGGNRPAFDTSSSGGELSTDQWFRGPAAPFAGVEWQISDKWGVKAEYSSDAYDTEVRQGVLTRKSRFNFGAEYQYSDTVRVGGYYLYGSELGLNVQIQLNPKRSLTPLRTPAPDPVAQRPSRNANPDAWTTAWVGKPEAPTILADALKPRLAKQGLEFVALKVTANSAEVRYRNNTYPATSVAIGRVSRAMAQIMPPSVETFRIVTMSGGLAQSAVTIRRSDLEALEFDPQAADALLAVTGISEAAPRLENATINQDLYPDFAWSVAPYVKPSYFDPDEPLRLDGGLKFGATFKPAPGWTISGKVTHRLFGNVGDSLRVSDSLIEPVRTNAVRYAGSDTALDNLYVSKQWKPGQNTYARVTAGYLERMFGGVSAELLWKPVGSRLALGVEGNYVKQRDFSGLGFQDYGVATGHASAYYEFNNGFRGQLDVGRYLAGDVGATVTLEREFNNGWRVGGFFTVTDVSSEDFGEGSFDKGILLTVPQRWFLGTPSKQTSTTTIRPVQRDGGARLSVPGRLYEQVRSGHRNALEQNWSGVWE